MAIFIRCAILFCILNASVFAHAETKWRTSVAEATREAAASGKLIFVDVYTDWCGPCKMMDQQVFPDPNVARMLQKVVPLRVNPETSRDGMELARKYKVDGYPSFLVLNEKGEVFQRTSGALPPEVLVQFVNEAVKRRDQLPLLEAKAKARPNDGAVAARLTTFYSTLERESAALSMLTRAEKYATPAEANNARMDVAYMLAQKGKAKESLPIFRKIIRNATTPSMRHLGRFNTAISLLQLGRNAEALPYLKQVINAKDVPEQFRQRAQSVLEAAQRPQS